MHKLFAGSLALGLVALSVACTVNNDGKGSGSGNPEPDASSPNPTTQPDGSTTQPDGSTTHPDGSTTPSGSIVSCGSQLPTGASVDPQFLPSQPTPVPAGGSFADGTYQLTAVKVYGATASNATAAALYGSLDAKETLELANGQWRIAYHYDASLMEASGVHAGTYVIAGTVLGGEEKCDAGDASNGIGGFLRPFTASGGTIDIFEDNAKEIVFTYTKQ